MRHPFGAEAEQMPGIDVQFLRPSSNERKRHHGFRIVGAEAAKLAFDPERPFFFRSMTGHRVEDDDKTNVLFTGELSHFCQPRIKEVERHLAFSRRLEPIGKSAAT